MTHLVSKLLQSPEQSLCKAAKLLNDTTEQLQRYRHEFSEVKNSAETVAKTWGTECVFKSKRKIRTKKFFDELSEDQRLHDPEQMFKVNVFYANLDIIINQMKNRFNSMYNIVQKFDFLYPSNLTVKSDDDLYKSAECLAEEYSDDLSPEFPQQLILLRNVLRQYISELKNGSINDLAKLLMLKNHILHILSALMIL